MTFTKLAFTFTSQHFCPSQLTACRRPGNLQQQWRTTMTKFSLAILRMRPQNWKILAISMMTPRFFIPDAHGESRKRKRSQTRPAPQPLISQEQRYWTAIAEPPDINYWRILCEDEQFKKAVVKDHVMHFEQRCLSYETHIFDLESLLACRV